MCYLNMNQWNCNIIAYVIVMQFFLEVLWCKLNVTKLHLYYLIDIVQITTTKYAGASPFLWLNLKSWYQFHLTRNWVILLNFFDDSSAFFYFDYVLFVNFWSRWEVGGHFMISSPSVQVQFFSPLHFILTLIVFGVCNYTGTMTHFSLIKIYQFYLWNFNFSQYLIDLFIICERWEYIICFD